MVLATSICIGPAQAIDMFGSGGDTFGIEFVEVGNAGNAHDTGGGGGSYSSAYGDVAYEYRISKYEISNDMIDRATNLGMANVVRGSGFVNQPAVGLDWPEAAAFVNWLNEDAGHQKAYDLTYSSGWSMTLWGDAVQATTGVDSGKNPYRHKDAVYFLPGEDEWYKAGYHQDDGVTANYWDYPTGSNTVPDGIDSSGDPTFDAVFNDGYHHVMVNNTENVGSSMSPHGTYGQGGNVWELLESAYDGSNDSTTEYRGVRGGHRVSTEEALRSSYRYSVDPTLSSDWYGFRVASVIPEPSSALLLLTGLTLLAIRRRP